MPYPRVSITDRAQEVVERLKKEHGELIFCQSKECSDLSPQCFPKERFVLGDCDVKVGEIAGCDFFMSEELFSYNRYTHLTIDVVKEKGMGLSLEVALGLRFVAIPRLFTKEELEDLEPVERVGSA